MSTKVSIANTKDYSGDSALGIAISAELEPYFGEVGERLKEDIDGAMQEAENVLKTESPYRRGSGRGHYRSGWRHVMKVDDGHITGVVYQSNKPMLTHLLEGGHRLVRNQKVIGFVRAFPHISRARQAASAYLDSKGWSK